NLKQGVTKREWNRGDLPVVPYPALHKGLGQWDYVEYSYRDSVGLEVFLFPKPGSGYSALTADVELVKGDKGRWLVDYWMPRTFQGPRAAGKGSRGDGRAGGRGRHARRQARAAPPPQAAPTTAARPSRAYWAIPIVILSLIVVVPLTLGAIKLRQNRK